MRETDVLSYEIAKGIKQLAQKHKNETGISLLTSWEFKFLSDIIGKTDFGMIEKFSDKQEKCILSIADKVKKSIEAA